jgi:hypothetical protein
MDNTQKKALVDKQHTLSNSIGFGYKAAIRKPSHTRNHVYID